MSVRETISKNINWLIDAREEGSPTAFAKALGVNKQRVNSWRMNKCAPDLEMIEKIADLYGFSLEWFIRGDTSQAPLDYEK